MPKSAIFRTDAWTEEHDAILTDIVLNSIRFGKTQLSAFEHAGTLLGRTPAACGFRWNGVVRKTCEDRIQRAKEERKALKGNNESSVPETTEVETVTSNTEMEKVIQFLKNYDDSFQNLVGKYEQVAKERDELLVRVRELETVPREQLTPEQIAEDTQTLLKILERARRVLPPNNVLSESV
ncbi:RsfA family transcriptional regulator [Alicyclobacillus fodiniaquatilis]|uniref:RsfA family transcriptional regulator n=1 Tax=Alicyclobacillus fodiniaquatilis TaxID=1661150 RepID=A0ABW4JEW9_9BACL